MTSPAARASDCVADCTQCLCGRSTTEVTHASDPTPDSPPKRDPPPKPVTASMNLCVERNRRRHHTDGYGEPDLIIRRGQEFDVIVSLSEEFDEQTEEIRLSFAIGMNWQCRATYLIPSV